MTDSSTRPGARTMWAARIHGPRDLRVEQIPAPGPPSLGQVIVRVQATGICGSDLHSYLDARIGDTRVEAPLVLGHEFAGVIEEVGDAACSESQDRLEPGMRVAVDPAQPCGHCELCLKGHPNLCTHLGFCGNFPYGGSLCERMQMPARSCFRLPDALDPIQGALLEPLGVALHAVDLARLRVADSVAVLGAGPIGLLILQLAVLSGASPIFVTDQHPWRLRAAEKLGGLAIPVGSDGGVAEIMRQTQGRGVDVAIEAAWGGEATAQAAEMVRLGGRLVMVGIPSDDALGFKHSTVRRKGLTIRLCRRMQHTYPRALALALEDRVDLLGLVTHRFPLGEAERAFELNASYQDEVIKVIVQS